MSFQSNRGYDPQPAEKVTEAGRHLRAKLRPLLDLRCEAMVMHCYCYTGKIEEAKRIAMRDFRRLCIARDSYWNVEDDSLRAWFLETFAGFCKDYPERWRRLSAQLSGEQQLNAESIRRIMTLLPEWYEATAWLYIFKAADHRITRAFFRRYDGFAETILNEVKEFLRGFFSGLFEVVETDAEDAGIQMMLRKIMLDAIGTNAAFRDEMKEMREILFTTLASDNRDESTIEMEFLFSLVDVRAWRKALIGGRFNC